MEDIINALLDVVRAQHSATEGTEEAPFNMDDIVDMAMNLMGRPEEAEEEADMISSIKSLVEEQAPDIFPPKTFEEQSDSERAASAASMIERSLNSGNRRNQQEQTQPDPYIPSYSYEEEEEEQGETDPGALNDLIYKNLMDMMGLQSPQVEYPFDRSQIVYGKEKSFTEQLEDDRREAEREQEEQKRKLSAWELAQNTIDEDEAAREKEPYIPQVEETPVTKSASQLAAEAIAASQQQEKIQLEIERQAEALMEEARQRGQDPMKFALHQQEILQYMEKNSDELVSFEDYEDLSPEEKYEIERQIQIEKELEAGVSPEAVRGEVPEEFIPQELKEKMKASTADSTAEESASSEAPAQPAFTEEMLRQLSQEVLRENADMIAADGSGEDMESLNAAIMENIMKMMSGSGVPVPQENVDDLLEQAAHNATEEPKEKPVQTEAKAEIKSEPKLEVKQEAPLEQEPELKSASVPEPKSEPVPEQKAEKKSAVELAKEALSRELERQRNEPEEEELNLDDLDDMFEDLDDEEEEILMPEEDEAESQPAVTSDSDKTVETTETQDINEIREAVKAEENVEKTTEKTTEAADAVKEELSDTSEATYESDHAEEYVLGEHTQAEVDEALENLQTLGLDGDVFERAKNMLLLEMAGSEIELERWRKEQESNKTKKEVTASLTDEEVNEDFDDDALEMEFESALDDFNDDFEEDEDDEDEEIPDNDTESAVEEASEESVTATAEESEEALEKQEAEAEEEVVGAAVEEKTEEKETAKDIEEVLEKEESTEDLVEEIAPEDVEIQNTRVFEERTAKERPVKTKKNVIHRREKTEKTKANAKVAPEVSDVQSKEYQVSIRNPFVLKNSASYMDKFEQYIVENQENRKLSTGFKRLDSMLRYGLHKGSYFIDATPMYLKNAFMQQLADRAAESGVDVLYISTELSRYELMTDTMSRLSYEMNGKDREKAVSVMSIMTGEEGASIIELKDELNWYRGRISEHLFILDQEAVDEVIDSMDDATPGDVLSEIIRSIVKEGAHKPVVFIDNLENIAFAQTPEEMQPLMAGIQALAKELSIPIIMSYGYSQGESYEDEIFVDKTFNQTIGNMCDVYMELQYAPMVTEDGEELNEEDIQEMMEEGESLLVDILLHRNRRNVKASCQIMTTPKFNFFEE